MQSIGHMLHPKKIEPHEIKLLAEKVAFERALVYSDPKNFLLEQVQSVAYRHFAFGNSVICDQEYESMVTAERLLNFYLRTMSHQGTSAVAVGVSHDVFARALPKMFEGLHYAGFGTMPYLAPDYHGGEARFEAGRNQSMATLAFPLPGGHSGPKPFALSSVIAKLFVPSSPVPYGSQSSLLIRSEPMKGISSITGSTQLYCNAGLLTFTLEGSGREAMTQALSRVRSAPSIAISEEDLARAKNAVLFEMRTKYDNGPGFIASASEQIIGSGKVFDIPSLQSAFNAITLPEIKKAVDGVFSAKPSLVTLGNSRELPYLDEI